MKTYMPLNGLRWSRNSGSANCDMPQSAVFGQPGGVWLRVLTFDILDIDEFLGLCRIFEVFRLFCEVMRSLRL